MKFPFLQPLAQGFQRAALKKRRLLLIAAVTVCLPLVLMMGLQYFWLLRLKTSSSSARDAAQDHFLHLVSQKVEYFYSRLAETMLIMDDKLLLGPRDELNAHLSQQFLNAVRNIRHSEEEAPVAAAAVAPRTKAPQSDRNYRPPELAPSDSQPGGLAMPETWTKDPDSILVSDINNASRLVFVCAFTGPYADQFMFMDPLLRIATPTINNADLDQVIRWACTYWQVRAKDPSPLKSTDLALDDRDPRFPMILSPVTDAEGHLVGVTGLVVDPVHFGDKILPRLVKQFLPLLDGQKDWQVKAFDNTGRLVLSNGSGSFIKNPKRAEKKAKLSSIFSDWKITLSSEPSTLERLAGTNFWYNITLSAILALALLGGVLYALRTASQELQLSEMKSDFVSNVSHELRTPLASIRVFGELLRLGRTSDPAKVREYGAHIESESRRLTRLINNILDFSKIESNQKIYQFERTDIEDVLSEIIQTFEARMFGGQVTIDYSGPDDQLPMILMDADALGQVFFNLLDNGIKYGNGCLELAVRLYREGDTAVIEFEDHGIGIAREQQDKIFERFHRVSTGLVHDVKGSGLGLAIARHVIEAHRGTIQVKSQLGQGSTFIIRLPLQDKEPVDTHEEGV